MRELQPGLSHWQSTLSAEQARDGRPDLAWLREGDAEVRWYGPGDRLPIGIEAFAGREHNDLVLWIEAHRVAVAGDSALERALS